MFPIVLPDDREVFLRWDGAVDDAGHLFDGGVELELRLLLEAERAGEQVLGEAAHGGVERLDGVEVVATRDADAVCSLFADDALLSGGDGWFVDGNALIAQLMTPFDDDRWFQQMVFVDIGTDGNVVTWTQEYHGLFGSPERSEGHRAVVEDGKITRFDWHG